MASNAPTECCICHEEYSKEQHCPRILPCLHTFCSKCIDQLIATHKKSCPVCRKKFRATSAQDVRENSTMLEFMKHIAATKHNKRSSNERETTSFPELKKKFKKATSTKALADCQTAKADIQRAIKTNSELEAEILQSNTKIRVEFFKKMEKIEKKNEKQIKDLKEEKSRLNAKLKLLVEEEKKVQLTHSKLEAARNFTVAGPIMDETQDITNKLETLLKDLQIYLSGDEIKRLSIRKNIEKTKAKISIIEDVLTPTEDDDDNDDEDEDVVNFIPGMVAMEIDEDTSQDNILVDDLRRMSGQVRQMLNHGRIFGVQDLSGRGRRYARITISQDELLCLHHLKKEESIPSDVRLIKYDEMMKLVDPSSSRLTFLELGVEGRSLGTLRIRLSPQDTKLTQQFSLLCTGEMGPSYVHTKILCVANKGHAKMECVLFGDYESNDGSGGKGILPGVDWEKEKKNKVHVRPLVVGRVTYFNNTEANAANFAITTRDRNNVNGIGVFGLVEEGMSILTEAVAQHPDIEKCFIRDCGIVLNL